MPCHLLVLEHTVLQPVSPCPGADSQHAELANSAPAAPVSLGLALLGVRECCGDAEFEQGLAKHALAQEAAQLHYGEVPILTHLSFWVGQWEHRERWRGRVLAKTPAVSCSCHRKATACPGLPDPGSGGCATCVSCMAHGHVCDN